VNELAVVFSQLGIDVVNVINGAATKPFSFMAHYPGCGIGGHCIPVDPYYLIDYAKKSKNVDLSFLSLACKTNHDMPKYTVSLLEEGLQTINKTIKDSRVAVLGLAYKANIDDIRESPSFEILNELKQKGANVKCFDPFVKDGTCELTLTSALSGSDAAIIATNHKQFLNLNPSIFKEQGIRIIIDGRNCLDAKIFGRSGLYYRGIGRQ
jgi:nucleotide sugar dehydrogenase